MAHPVYWEEGRTSSKQGEQDKSGPNPIQLSSTHAANGVHAASCIGGGVVREASSK